MTEPALPDPAAVSEPHERWEALRELEAWLRVPIFVWLAPVVAEPALGSSKLFETFGTVIWIVFLVEFALRLALAPEKLPFLRRDWLTVIALLVPALRLFSRVARPAGRPRAARPSAGADRRCRQPAA